MAARNESSRATWASLGKTGPNSGRKFTDEQRAERSELCRTNPALVAQWTEHQRKGRQSARQLGYRRWPSRIHAALYRFLREAGHDVECEIGFGRYSVDLYDREYNIAFEADGARWHVLTRQQVWRDRKRDAALVRDHGLAAVVRFDEADIAALAE
jgi:very-short-patch-repair endonuclease